VRDPSGTSSKFPYFKSDVSDRLLLQLQDLKCSSSGRSCNVGHLNSSPLLRVKMRGGRQLAEYGFIGLLTGCQQEPRLFHHHCQIRRGLWEASKCTSWNKSAPSSLIQKHCHNTSKHFGHRTLVITLKSSKGRNTEQRWHCGFISQLIWTSARSQTRKSKFSSLFGKTKSHKDCLQSILAWQRLR
jgi:hypothetical protein